LKNHQPAYENRYLSLFSVTKFHQYHERREVAFLPSAEAERIIGIMNEADELLEQHGLAQQGWRFEFTHHKTSLGTCFYDRKVIGFSKYFINSPPETITDTLLHEIAHALTPPTAQSHGAHWRNVARSIGATPKSCAEQGTFKVDAKFNYVIKCPNCNWQVRRYRMRRRNFNSYCPECGTKVQIFRIKRR
jgi:predicted SprT family Zn-dependent metalloprotease